MIDYKRLKVGDSITIQDMEGEVVYIHPEQRFFRVRFVNDHGDVFHECFRMHPSEKALKSDQAKINESKQKEESAEPAEQAE